MRACAPEFAFTDGVDRSRYVPQLLDHAVRASEIYVPSTVSFVMQHHMAVESSPRVLVLHALQTRQLDTRQRFLEFVFNAFPLGRVFGDTDIFRFCGDSLHG